MNLNERTIEEIARSIRAIRKQKGLTLKEVEAQSQGVWKAVVIGSYERCDRALSLKKAISLANFYQVPLDELLGIGSAKSEHISEIEIPEKFTIDIRRISNLAKIDEKARQITSFLALLCAKRKDWNGEVISIRISDIETIALLGNETEIQSHHWLRQNSLLIRR
jgi:transcriptional regulator with XRE-family HTH domain